MRRVLGGWTEDPGKRTAYQDEDLAEHAPSEDFTAVMIDQHGSTTTLRSNATQARVVSRMRSGPILRVSPSVTVGEREIRAPSTRQTHEP